MRRHIILVAPLVILLVITSVGFQCGSTEMTSAKLYIQRSDWENAIRSLEEEVSKNPTNEEAWFLLGRVKGQVGDYQGMNEAFKQALGVGQTYAADIHDTRLGYWGRHLNIGVDYYNRARDTAEYYDKAIESFRTAIVINPDSAAGYKNLGFALLSKDEVFEALESLKKAFSISKDILVARYLGELYYDIGLRHREKFDSPTNRTEITIGMTLQEVRALLGEPTSKSTTKDKKVTKDKWVYANRDLSLNFEQGQLRSWEEQGRVEEKEPKVFYNSYVERDTSVKYFDISIGYLEQARQIEPKNAEILAALSNAYVAAEKADVAIETFKSGVEADPRNKVFRYNYGVLLMKAEDYQEAIEQFEVAVALDSTYESALYNLGVAYVNWGVYIRESAEDPSKVENTYKEKFRLAVPHLEMMTRLRPSNPDAWELLGKVYANLGKSKEATAAFGRADEIRKGK